MKLIEEDDMEKNLNIRKVITPVDFSKNADFIARSAIYIAGTFKASLTFVFVVQNFEDYSGFFVPEMNMPNLERDLHLNAEKKMQSFCEEYNALCQEHGVASFTNKVLVGDVADQITEFAMEEDGDLIVMGTHGYKGLEKVMFGSVADKVVKMAHCPVTTINPYTCCE